MAIDCSTIKVGVSVTDCADDATPGTTGRLILLSYTDIDRAGSTVASNVITELLLKAGKLGYEVHSLPDADVGSTSLVAGTYKNSFSHNIVARVFIKTEQTKEFVNQFTSARVVGLLENSEAGADGAVKWEVYGWDSGLKLTELESTTAMADGVVYGLTLATPETGREGSIPKSFFKTDEATTDAAIESLITLVR